MKISDGEWLVETELVGCRQACAEDENVSCMQEIIIM
jgi:hypothetical protein